MAIEKSQYQNGVRAARESWNGQCAPNGELLEAQPDWFRKGFDSEWDRLSVYGRNGPGCDSYGMPFTVNLDTGRATR